MPSVGARCHELQVRDEEASWRVLYRIDEDAIVLPEVFSKKTGARAPSFDAKMLPNPDWNALLDVSVSCSALSCGGRR